MCALLLLTVVLVVLALPAPATADTTAGLEVRSSSLFAIDPTTGVVAVRIELELTNTTVDETADGVLRRRYFTGFTFPVARNAGVPRAATAAGAVATVERTDPGGDTSFVAATVQLPQPLFAGDSERVVVTYEITGAPPRSADPTRVSPAYVAFTAYAVGDPGLASVQVVVPPVYAVDTVGSDDGLDRAEGPEATVLTAGAVTEPERFALFVTARNDEALQRRALEIRPGVRFVLRGWPGDDEWLGFVTDQIERGLPALEELIEHPWPLADELEVRQAVTPHLYGYAGWFSPAEAELEVGEDLDPEVVLHELSHAWFNTSWFADRWLNEGLAQVYSNTVVALRGGSPTVPPEPAADDPARIPLADWGPPLLDSGADDTETYGYRTAHWVVQHLVEEVGFAAMARVFAAVDAGTTAYPGEVVDEVDDRPGARPTDWRRFLDLAEGVAGSSELEPLLVAHVLTDEQAGQLDARREARAALSALSDDGNGWAPPLGLRRAMAAWAFEDAAVFSAAAGDVLAVRPLAVDRGEAAGGIDLLRDAESGYEAAATVDDLVALRDVLATRAEVADVVRRAAEEVDAARDLVERVGLWGRDPGRDVEAARQALAAGDTDGARAAAERAVAAIDAAGGVGAQRLAVAGAAALLASATVLTTVAMVRRRRRAAPAAAVRPPTPDPSR